MLRKLLFLSCILIIVNLVNAQTAPANNDDEYEKAYNKRITKEYIYGVYIPKDLTDAFISLNSLTAKESRIKFKTLPEPVAVEKLHFSLGRWMIHNWGFYEGSRLSSYLKGMGIHHPDDMARFIMLSYHRNLNRKPLEIKKQLEQIEAKYLREKEAKIQSGTILHEEKRIRKKN